MHVLGRGFISHCRKLSTVNAVCFRQQFQGTEFNSRCPVSQFWDENEPRLFVCETVPISSECSPSRIMDTVRSVSWYSWRALCDNHFDSVFASLCSDQHVNSHTLLYTRAWDPPTGLLPPAFRPAGTSWSRCAILLFQLQGEDTENYSACVLSLKAAGGCLPEKFKGNLSQITKPNPVFFPFKFISVLMSNCVTPALISEGGFLSSRSKCLSPAAHSETSVFLIPSSSYCDCAAVKQKQTQVYPWKSSVVSCSPSPCLDWWAMQSLSMPFSLLLYLFLVLNCSPRI